MERLIQGLRKFPEEVIPALPRLAAQLDTIPEGSELHVNIFKLQHIDHACMDSAGLSPRCSGSCFAPVRRVSRPSHDDTSAKILKPKEYYVLVSVCLALGFFATVCRAQERVTLPRALELADLLHPQLDAGRAQVDVARAGVLTATHYPNPAASISSGRQTFRVPGNVSGQISIYSFEQPLELGSLRPSRIQFADRFRETTVFALAEIRLAVLAGVRRTFFQVLRRRGEAEIATESLRLVEDLRRRIRVRVEVGEAGRLELIRADAEVATAVTFANSAQLQLVTALAQFRAAVGAPLATVIEPEGTLDPPVIFPALEELRKAARERHPASQLAQSEVRRAESRIAHEKALRRPQPSLRADVERYPDTPNYRVGITIPIPFWNRREGPVAEATAALRQASSLAQARQIQILTALDGAYGRYQMASQQLAAFELGLLREADEAVRATETAYQLGERGILEALDAQRVLRTVRMGFLNAQYDRQAALVDLDELRAVDLRSANP